MTLINSVIVIKLVFSIIHALGKKARVFIAPKNFCQGQAL